MNTFRKPGNIITLTAPSGGVLVDEGYIVGSFFSVATNPAAVGEEFEGMVTGQLEMDKTAPQVWAEGDTIWWDDTLKEATNVAADMRIGVATDAALSAAVLADVRLDGIGAAPLLTAADLAKFTSTLLTGTGASQLVAHGLTGTPSWAIPTMTSGHDGAGGLGTQAGQAIVTTIDATNVDVTVTDGVTFYLQTEL